MDDASRPMTPVDLRLYANHDPARAGGRTLADLAQRVAEGGATLIQYRDKDSSTRAMVEQAKALRRALAPSRVPLIVNDRVDVALAARADGVHVGQDDMEAADARRLLGPDAIIGLSVKTLAQVQAAPIEHLDYVAIGGVFATGSKDNPEPPIGISGLRVLADAVRARTKRLAIGAIAGIDERNAASIIAAGADGVAVISALSLAPDPGVAATKLREIVDEALKRRQAEAR
jgi:thiamine-phosphate pyrophosphorylase